jgi:hypothetical protein
VYPQEAQEKLKDKKSDEEFAKEWAGAVKKAAE